MKSIIVFVILPLLLAIAAGSCTDPDRRGDPTRPDGAVDVSPDGTDDATDTNGNNHTTLCATTLMEFIGWELAGREILASSQSEYHCAGTDSACYEALFVFVDGTVTYQRVDALEHPLACEEVTTLSQAALAHLESILASIDDTQPWEDFSPAIDCGAGTEGAVDEGVDTYRGHLPEAPHPLPLLFDNMFCKGFPGSPGVKEELDLLWAASPRDIYM